MKKANNSGHKKDKKSKQVSENDDMLDDYSFLDWSKAERGKHAKRLAQGTNVVLIEPDLTDLFPNSESVNRALRALAEIIRSAPSKTRSRKGSAAQQRLR